MSVIGETAPLTAGRSKTPKPRRTKKKDEKDTGSEQAQVYICDLQNLIKLNQDEKDRGSGVYVLKNGAAKYGKQKSYSY